jgi:uncharacterized protein DUF6471
VQDKWNKQATNILKAELTRRAITYEMLHEKLLNIGVKETANSINVKINRGAFGFAFFLQCAAAIGIKNLRLDDLIEEEK